MQIAKSHKTHLRWYVYVDKYRIERCDSQGDSTPRGGWRGGKKRGVHGRPHKVIPWRARRAWRNVTWRRERKRQEGIWGDVEVRRRREVWGILCWGWEEKWGGNYAHFKQINMYIRNIRSKQTEIRIKTERHELIGLHDAPLLTEDSTVI